MAAVWPNLAVPSFDVASKGRWPRICAQRLSLSTPRRIAMLSLHTSPLAVPGRSRDAGGMNVYIRDLARYLGRQYLAVDIFTRRTEPDLPTVVPLSANVRLIHIPAGPSAPIQKQQLYPLTDAFAEGVLRFTDENTLSYDLLHSHYWLSGVSGERIARTLDIPHLIMFHTLARLKQQARPEEQESDLRIAEEHRLIHTVDGIIVATADEQRQIDRLYHHPVTPLFCIPCGVDLGRFTPQDRSAARALLTDRYDLDDSPLLLFVGRLEPLKGADLLIESFSTMQQRAQLLLVGGDERDPERSRLRAKVQALGIASRVRFIDAVPQDALLPFYRAADILTIASHYESFGLTAVEALACGTPVIAPAVGGLPSIVQPGINGMLVSERTADQYRQALDTLVGDTEMLDGLRSRARESVTRFGWHAVAQQVRDCYVSFVDQQMEATV